MWQQLFCLAGTPGTMALPFQSNRTTALPFQTKCLAGLTELNRSCLTKRKSEDSPTKKKRKREDSRTWVSTELNRRKKEKKRKGGNIISTSITPSRVKEVGISREIIKGS